MRNPFTAWREDRELARKACDLHQESLRELEKTVDKLTTTQEFHIDELAAAEEQRRKDIAEAEKADQQDIWYRRRGFG